MLVPSERLIVVNAAEATNGETPTRRHRFTIAHAVPLGLPRAAGRGGREDELDEYAVGSRAEAMHVVALAHRLTRLATAPKGRPSAAECGVAPTRTRAGLPSRARRATLRRRPPLRTQRNSRHHPARRAKNPSRTSSRPGKRRPTRSGISIMWRERPRRSAGSRSSCTDPVGRHRRRRQLPGPRAPAAARRVPGVYSCGGRDVFAVWWGRLGRPGVGSRPR